MSVLSPCCSHTQTKPKTRGRALSETRLAGPPTWHHARVVRKTRHHAQHCRANLRRPHTPPGTRCPENTSPRTALSRKSPAFIHAARHTLSGKQATAHSLVTQTTGAPTHGATPGSSGKHVTTHSLVTQIAGIHTHRQAHVVRKTGQHADRQRSHTAPLSGCPENRPPRTALSRKPPARPHAARHTLSGKRDARHSPLTRPFSGQRREAGRPETVGQTPTQDVFRTRSCFRQGVTAPTATSWKRRTRSGSFSLPSGTAGGRALPPSPRSPSLGPQGAVFTMMYWVEPRRSCSR